MKIILLVVSILIILVLGIALNEIINPIVYLNLTTAWQLAENEINRIICDVLPSLGIMLNVNVIDFSDSCGYCQSDKDVLFYVQAKLFPLVQEWYETHDSNIPFNQLWNSISQ